jgi:hypothetical protein
LDSQFLAVLEAEFMVSRNDDFVFVRQRSHCCIEVDDLSHVSIVCEVSRMDENISIGDLVHDFIQLAVRVRYTDKADFVFVDRSVQTERRKDITIIPLNKPKSFDRFTDTALAQIFLPQVDRLR